MPSSLKQLSPLLKMTLPCRSVKIPSPGQEYEFVTYTKAPQRAAQDAGIRETVRSRAMRAYHATRGEKPKTVQHQQATEPARLKDSIGRFRVTIKKALKVAAPEKEQSSTQPVQFLPLLDPFVTSLGGEAWQLLHFCK